MSKKYLLYIHHPNFQQEKKKSDLVNRLLDEHYNSGIQQESTQETLNVYTNQPSSPRTLSSPKARTEPVVRTTKDVLKEIEEKKIELNELLEVSQDRQDHIKVQNQIQALWDEYHTLKESDD